MCIQVFCRCMQLKILSVFFFCYRKEVISKRRTRFFPLRYRLYVAQTPMIMQLLYFQGKFDKIAEYKTSNIIEHLKPVPLNPDHTHFIFVDNGLRNVYKGVAEFRARFEKKLSDPVEKGMEHFPCYRGLNNDVSGVYTAG